MVFQDFQLLTDRSVNNNLKFVLKATGWKDEKLMDEKIADVLEKVGLKTKGFKMPFELSGGEQQRMEYRTRDLKFAETNFGRRAYAATIDPETSDEIMKLLFNISRDYGTAVIMATHDYMVIQKFPARTMKTERGKVYDNASIATS